VKKFREYFRPKPKEKKQPLPLSYYFIIAVLSLLILNFALLLPPQLSALFFEFELLVLQFLMNPITMQTWAWIIFAFVAAWLGWFLMPVVEIPQTHESRFYVWRREEGSDMYFRTLSGKELVMNVKAAKRKLLRWTVTWPVSRMPQGSKIIVYETEKMEVSTELKFKRYAEMLAEEIAHLYAEKSRSETRLSLEEVIAILKAKHGGELE